MPIDFLQNPLTHNQARVLGTLMEKARTVPDSYPLSLNSLTLGCNQKTSRDPVTNLSEDDAQDALDGLKKRHLVLQASGSRVARWEHNFLRTVGLPEQESVILGLLMLRGPQTAAELRANAERWYKFADSGLVEVFLQQLADRSEEKGGPMAVLLPRATGAKEQRWMHLLCGPVNAATATVETDEGSRVADTYRALQQRIDALEATVVKQQASIDRLVNELGMTL
jgi:uncharacterized protein